MANTGISRRAALSRVGQAAVAATMAGTLASGAQAPADGQAASGPAEPGLQGDQRLSLARLQAWEALGYGMFIHFGMSTFVENELPDGKAPATAYAPDKLDVDQWVSVARDAGMKYAVLTAKHVAGHCLWPSRYTSYTVAKSTNTTDVCEAFVAACRKRGLKAGFYYCSWDNHNRFGSRTPSDPGHAWGAWPWAKVNWAEVSDPPPDGLDGPLPAYTTSVYQGFQTAQLSELIARYGPLDELWIDIPGVLGRDYRTFLYQHLARLQPEAVIMMNNGIGSGEFYDYHYAWPADLIAIERAMPPEAGHRKWREIEGKRYYMPGELCDPIGKEWFFVPGDAPRPLAELTTQVGTARSRGVNVLLDVPPDKHGLIPDMHVQALMALRRELGW